MFATLMKKGGVRIPVVLACFLLLSLLVRIVMFDVFLDRNSVRSFEYSDIAKNIVTGKGYSYDHLGTSYKSFGPPLYSILISIFYRFAGITVIPVIYFQIILSLLSCVILFFIARRLADEKIALMASIICLFHPGLVLYSVKIVHSLPLDIFLFLSAIISVMRLRENMSFTRAALAGLIFGLAALSRPSIIAFAAISVLWLFFALDRAFKTKAVNILLLICIATMPVSLWIIRNYMVHKEIILTTTCDAEVFWRGNNVNASGASYRPDGNVVLESDEKLYDKLLMLDELGKRELFREEAIGFIKNNPGKFVILYLKKLYYFWWFSPVSGILYPDRYLLVYKIFYMTIVFFAFMGLASLFKKSNPDVNKNMYLLLLFLISTSLFQALYYIEGRHRWGVEPVLLIFSAAGIAALSEKTFNIISQKSRH